MAESCAACQCTERENIQPRTVVATLHGEFYMTNVLILAERVPNWLVSRQAGQLDNWSNSFPCPLVHVLEQALISIPRQHSQLWARGSITEPTD
jgi:hypothetical protein